MPLSSGLLSEKRPMMLPRAGPAQTMGAFGSAADAAGGGVARAVTAGSVATGGGTSVLVTGAVSLRATGGGVSVRVAAGGVVLAGAGALFCGSGVDSGKDCRVIGAD